MVTITGTKTHCLHYLATRCTAQFCRWKDEHDAMVCALGGILGADHLTERVKDGESRESSPKESIED